MIPLSPQVRVRISFLETNFLVSFPQLNHVFNNCQSFQVFKKMFRDLFGFGYKPTGFFNTHFLVGVFCFVLVYASLIFSILIPAKEL